MRALRNKRARKQVRDGQRCAEVSIARPCRLCSAPRAPTPTPTPTRQLRRALTRAGVGVTLEHRVENSAPGREPWHWLPMPPARKATVIPLATHSGAPFVDALVLVQRCRPLPRRPAPAAPSRTSDRTDTADRPASPPPPTPEGSHTVHADAKPTAEPALVLAPNPLPDPPRGSGAAEACSQQDQPEGEAVLPGTAAQPYYKWAEEDEESLSKKGRRNRRKPSAAADVPTPPTPPSAPSWAPWVAATATAAAKAGAFRDVLAAEAAASPSGGTVCSGSAVPLSAPIAIPRRTAAAAAGDEWTSSYEKELKVHLPDPLPLCHRPPYCPPPLLPRPVPSLSTPCPSLYRSAGCRATKAPRLPSLHPRSYCANTAGRFASHPPVARHRFRYGISPAHGRASPNPPPARRRPRARGRAQPPTSEPRRRRPRRCAR